MSSMYHGGICFITDRSITDLSIIDMSRAVLAGGVTCLQYRDKYLSRREVHANARELRKLADEFGANLIINDHADIALAADADGVHLGQDDLPLREARKIMGRKIIGVSTHSLAQAVEAAEAGADYIGFGPVFQTSTKDAGSPVGITALKTVREAVSIPIIAIGGINSGNIASVIEAGADAVAIASGILRGVISTNIAELMKTIRGK